MTREELMKVRLNGFMEVEYIYVHPHESGNVLCSCMLLAVDFVEEILTLEPFPTEEFLEVLPFRAHISHCRIPKKEKPKLKVSR